MTLEEVEAIDRLERQWRTANRSVQKAHVLSAALLAVFPACVGYVIALGWNFDFALRVAGTIFLTVGFALAVFFHKIAPPTNLSLGTDRHDGEVALLEVHALAALRIGGSFLIDLGEGHVIYLRGPYLSEPVRRGEFPSTSFTLIRLPWTDMTLSVLCHGPPLVARTVPDERTREADLWKLADATVMSGTLASFAEAA